MTRNNKAEEITSSNGLFYKVPSSRKEAEAIQSELRGKVICENRFSEIKTIAGADIAVIKTEKTLVCGIIVFSFPELKEVARASVVAPEKFPYIPGLLSFREGPAIIEAFLKLKTRPDLLMLDGQGIAHNRGFGIASHIGVLLDIPAIGVAKKKLYGTYDEPNDAQGSWTPLNEPGKRKAIGAVLRTKPGVKPVFISTGHRITLATALEITLGCCRGYRVPEPTRQADIFASELKRDQLLLA